MTATLAYRYLQGTWEGGGFIETITAMSPNALMVADGSGIPGAYEAIFVGVISTVAVNGLLTIKYSFPAILHHVLVNDGKGPSFTAYRV